jgi:phosphatidylserine/phosphatidylglycerophosphate/cardiolipin synthase-like enzyme
MRFAHSARLFAALVALTASLVGAGCAAPAEDAVDQQGEAIGPAQPLSYVGDAVVARLQAMHPQMKGHSWAVSRDNALKGDFVVQVPGKNTFGADDIVAAPRCTSGDRCDADFGLYVCEVDSQCGGGGVKCSPLEATIAHRGQQAQRRCVGDADFILDEVWNGIAKADKTVDVSSLTAPDGRYEAAVRNAITYLSEKDAPPSVRMLFGDFPGSFASASKTLASVTRDVRPASRISVHVATYRAGVSSWNHSKIISRDGNYTLLGGANLWDVHYLGKDPVHDLWIRLSGSAAGDAARYLDQLWGFACAGSSLGNLRDVAARDGSSRCPAMFGAGPKTLRAGNTNVIGVGRLGALGEQSSDDAILAMIDSARTTIRLSQQDLGPIHLAGASLGSWPEATMLALVSAMDRGVDVSLTLSNTGAVPGSISAIAATFNTYDNGWTPLDVAQRFAALADKHPEAHPQHPDATSLLCSKLQLMRLRSSAAQTWRDGRTLANHAKVVVVDDRAFYVGSQNLYVANLAEFGVIVDDVAATKVFNESYMSRVESYSKRTAVMGPNAGCVLYL